MFKRFYYAKIITIEPVVFLFMLASSMFIILSEQYYYKVYGLQALQNTSFSSSVNGSICLTDDLLTDYTGNNQSYKDVQSYSNHLVLYVQLVNKFVSMTVTTILIAPLTDRIGRKIGLILPGIGNFLQGILVVFIIKYELHPYYFILGGFISGMFGDLTSTLATSFAYIADISTVRWRSFRIGIIEGFMAVGSATGQLTGGYWLQKTKCDYIPPMLLYISSSVAIVLYVAIFLPPELTSVERQQRLSKKESLISSYIKGIKLYCGGLDLKVTWKLYVATIVANVAALNIYGSSLFSILYLKSPPLEFKSSQIGLYQSVRSLTQGFANLFITGILVAISVSDMWLMLIAFLFGGTCDLLMGFSKSTWQIYTLAVFQGIEGIAWSGSRGLASKLTKPEQQGALFSIVASTESITTLLASVLWPAIYPATLHHNMNHGTTYFIIAAVSFSTVLLILTLLFVRSNKIEQKIVNQLTASNEDEKEPLLYTKNA